MQLGERIRNTLAVAGLTPRHLGAATRVHFVTIYRIMNADSDEGVTNSTEYMLTQALDHIDVLVDDNMLPFTEKLSKKEKIAKLTYMLDERNRGRSGIFSK